MLQSVNETINITDTKKENGIIIHFADKLPENFTQTFTAKGDIQLDGKKLDWCKNESAMQKRWNDAVKYRVLAKYVEIEEAQNTKKDTVTDWKIMSPQVMEDSARRVVKKNMDMKVIWL